MTVSIRCLHATSISVFFVLFSRHSYNTDKENLFSQVVAAAAEAISECVVKKEVRQSRLLIVSLSVHRDEEFFSDIPHSVIGLFCPYSTNQMQLEFNMNCSYQVFSRESLFNNFPRFNGLKVLYFSPAIENWNLIKFNTVEISLPNTAATSKTHVSKGGNRIVGKLFFGVSGIFFMAQRMNYETICLLNG